MIHGLDIKSIITEWIMSILEIIFKFMFCKMTERHSDRIRLRVLNIELGDGLISLRIVFLKLKNEVEPRIRISS